MRFVITLFSFLSVFMLHAQIKGIVTDQNGQPLPFVNIYIENTYIGTTTNENGQYELHTQNREKVSLVFQYLGFKTKKMVVHVDRYPYDLDITLQEDNYTLQEVVVNTKENPAIPIIRNAIKHRKENSNKTARFTADFYSKGIFRLKNAPKKILGQEIGDLDGSLDSTGTGIVYLSETISKITFEKPDQLKERIIASKVSGNDNGYSFNTARATRYDFYDNTVSLFTRMISPIADNAFTYYKYELEATFYDSNNYLINKIKVIPRRDYEPVFEGYIYIVEDSWAIYAVELEVKGYRVKEEFIESLLLKQNYSYNTENHIWAKNTQSMEFEAGIFGIGFSAQFTYVYTNYDFRDSFDRKTFSREILSFEENANKKDSLYWLTNRPVLLTNDEQTDYIRKDSIRKVRTSKIYLDSIDAKGNRFKPLDVISGYTYSNSYANWRVGYEGVLQLPQFNTVQGWHINTGFFFRTMNEESRRYTSLGVQLNYGFAEDRLRAVGYYNTRLFPKANAWLSVTGGSKLQQFNASDPITPLINSVSTLFFKENFMKLYENNFAKIQYRQEVINGLYLMGAMEYSRRSPLFNNTDYVLIRNNKEYTSNNPLQPEDNETPIFERHELAKFRMDARIRFAQKYLSRPDGKLTIPNNKYPVVFLSYEKGFSGSEKRYEYDLGMIRLDYDHSLGNKGDFAIRLGGGKFFNAEEISFADYRHFNGNQTYVTAGGRYLNTFHLLPYYSHSTNDRYMETHFEHNFNGFIMNKIPLLNHLKSTLILGYHQLALPGSSPYQEFSIGLDKLGFGKFRLFRLDYVRAYQGSGFVTDGIMFGLKFLDIVQ